MKQEVLHGDILGLINKLPRCIECGACCVNSIDRKWIEVTAEDALLLPANSYGEGDIKKYSMKQDASGRCEQLHGSVLVTCRCKIYSNRPQICRDVKPGSEICILSIKRIRGY